ncbi:MAG: hypothetical protein LCH53_14520 [Bacteroidetes bacterium]|nr:hypothetical protein [Bacteroidota bacterium]
MEKPLLWIERAEPQWAGRVSPLGRRIHALLDLWALGIYHISHEVRHKRVDWSNPNWIEIVVRDGLSTFDSDGLTRLVLLAHDHALRVEVEAAAHGYLRLVMHGRSHKEKSLARHHPTLEDAVARHRKHHPVTSL